MNRLFILVLLTLLSTAILLAGANNKSIGTTTSTSIVNGVRHERMETTPAANPLPLTGVDNQQKSTPIPHSNTLHTSVRWTSSHPTSIAQDLAVNSNGGNQFIGWYLNEPRVSFHNDESGTPVWEVLSDPQAYRSFVALSANANIVASASYRNIHLFDKSTGAVTFNFEIPNNRSAGPIAVSRDGNLVVCATASPLAGGIHRVYAFAPPSIVPIWTFDFSDGQSSGIYGVNISVDKSTVVVNGKFYAWVLNGATGVKKTEFEVANTESRIALNANGTVIAVAELSGFVKALSWNAAQSRYALLWQYKIPAGAFTNWASAVEVSADGSTIMAGTLIFLSAGYDGSIYMFDTFGEGQPNWMIGNVGDEVAQVALSDDGSLAAAATWGDIANARPDVYVFERNSNTPVFTLDTPGSMFAIAMSADGKSVVTGGKAVHARAFGNGGNVYNIAVDLGGGAIAGTVALAGATDFRGATVQVVGTTRSAITDSLGTYLVKNVPSGIYTVRVSKQGYVAATIVAVTVSGTDTTRNVNATLSQTGPAPTNLVASHSLDSRIQLNWSVPPEARMSDEQRLLATDDYTTSASVAAVSSRGLRRLATTMIHADPPPPDSIKIYRGVRSGGPYYLKKTIPGSVLTYVDSSALPLRDYYYRITSLYGQGESVYSNESYGTVDSSFLQFSITTPHRTATPTIDGVLSPGEWTDALRVDASDVFGNGGGVQLSRGSAFLYFKYDSVAGKLYIAGEDFLNTDGLQNSEGFGLYFDDNNNKRFEAINGEPLLREGNFWAYYFTTGSTVRFREIYSNGGVNAVVDTVTDAQTAFSSATGHVTGEVSIPISFFNKNHLQVYGLDKIVGAGIFMIGRNAGNPVYHGWWPQTMVSVFTPSGFGGIRIPIRLLAPPKAPTNLAVNKQGNFLRVTWTDPSQGLNGDPLTVPTTLQLYKNGALIRQFATGVQTFTDSNVVAQGWYEYKLRGSITVTAQTYFGPYTSTVGNFAVTDPQLAEVVYDDGIPEAFYVVDFNYNDNKFAIRFTPQQYPARVYRVKAFTNNGNSPINVSIHADSSGFPGALKAGPYLASSYQASGIDSFLVTVPGTEPPTIESGDFFVVLSYLPTSPGAPGIGGDLTQPIAQRSMYYTTALGWTPLANADLIVRAFITGQPNDVAEPSGVPFAYSLYQNYPNPFNPATIIKFTIPVGTGHAPSVLKVYDLLGREIATLVNEVKEPGAYTVQFDATSLASGTYFYKLQSGAYTAVRRMMLVK